jgi:hypothetical protein
MRLAGGPAMVRSTAEPGWPAGSRRWTGIEASSEFTLDRMICAQSMSNATTGLTLHTRRYLSVQAWFGRHALSPLTCFRCRLANFLRFIAGIGPRALGAGASVTVSADFVVGPQTPALPDAKLS